MGEGPHSTVRAPFLERQSKTPFPLITGIVGRNGIGQENVLGHSDIAPQRKQDPGAVFPWKCLDAEVTVPRRDDATTALKRIEYATVLPDIARFQGKLSAPPGYVVRHDDLPGDATRDVLTACQTRYRPTNIDGVADADTDAPPDSPTTLRR